MIPELEPSRGTEIHAGDILGGRYRAESLIGRSETGVVVEATDLLRGDSVAIKMIEPALEEADVMQARIRREADLLAQLTSPHVVRVLGVEKHNSSVCIVMERLRGANLAELLRKRGPLPVDEAVGLIVQACDALAEAHSLGIVHRDIKPQNLFLAERPDGTTMLKVLDFGVSKQAGGMGLTSTGAAVGSPLYTAIEQFKDASRVDARADIWSLGLVLYFLLCRRNAFDGDNHVALMLKIATSPPIPLRERRPDVPPDLEAVILQCVEKDREHRFRNVGALARALVPFGPPWVAGFVPSIEARLSRRSLPSLPPVSTRPPSVAPAPVVPRPPALPSAAGMAAAPGAPPAPNRPVPSSVPVAPSRPVPSSVPVAPNRPVPSSVPVAPSMSMAPNVPVPSSMPMAPGMPMAPSVPMAPNMPMAPNVPMAPNMPVPSNMPMAPNMAPPPGPAYGSPPVLPVTGASSGIPMWLVFAATFFLAIVLVGAIALLVRGC